MFRVCRFPADEIQVDCQNATAKVFRSQKMLQGTSFHILASAVHSLPSVLATVDPSKAERVVHLSGSTWPTYNPKVRKDFTLSVSRPVFTSVV